MEFYRLNYSLAIFAPEANIKSKTENRGELAKKVGVAEQREKPLLLTILEALASGTNVTATKKQ